MLPASFSVYFVKYLFWHNDKAPTYSSLIYQQNNTRCRRLEQISFYTNLLRTSSLLLILASFKSFISLTRPSKCEPSDDLAGLGGAWLNFKKLMLAINTTASCLSPDPEVFKRMPPDLGA